MIPLIALIIMFTTVTALFIHNRIPKGNETWFVMEIVAFWTAVFTLIASFLFLLFKVYYVGDAESIAGVASIFSIAWVIRQWKIIRKEPGDNSKQET